MSNKTIVTYVSNGSTKIYTFPFDYLRKEFVKVLVEGQPVAFTVSNTHEITLDVAPDNGKVITIKRETDTDKLVDFVDGSVLLANDLNVSALQSLHIAAEALDAAGASLVIQEDGAYSAGFRRISDVGDPTEDKDAATKGFVETSMTSQVNQATTKATEALASQTAAAASQTAAAGSASAAAGSETNAANSASAASTSETNAANSASAASSSQSDVATKYSDFDDKYLGSFAANPTQDNQGDALKTGQLYFNTSTKLMMVFNATPNDWFWIGSDPGISVLSSNVTFDPANVNTSEANLQVLLEGIIKGTHLDKDYLDLATGGTVSGSIHIDGDYWVRNTGKNEAGVVFRHPNGNSAAYLFHDESGASLKVNTYNASGAYTGNPLSIAENGAEVTLKAHVRVDHNTLRIGDDAVSNKHLYFNQAGKDRALIYNPANTSSLLFNMYNAAGAFEGTASATMANGRSRLSAGDFLASSGLYFGPRPNNAAVLQSEIGNNGVFFRDLHYLGYVGGQAGPTSVALVGANAANSIAGYNYCDLWSDINIKDNIQPTEVDALKELNALTVVSYDWNENAKAAFGPGLDTSKRVEIGLIAQDVETLDPSLVTKMKSADETDEFLMINKKEMVPHLIKAIQQLTARIEELEAGAA